MKLYYVYAKLPVHAPDAHLHICCTLDNQPPRGYSPITTIRARSKTAALLSYINTVALLAYVISRIPLTQPPQQPDPKLY